jgi:hypothetical protein
MASDVLYSLPQALPSVNKITLVQSLRKLPPDLEENDLQSFPDKEISKYEILDKVQAVKSFENTVTDVEKLLYSDVCELCF